MSKKRHSADTAISFVRARVDRHDFANTDQAENIAFSYNVIEWLMDKFALSSNRAFVSSTSDGFDASLLPEDLRQLVGQRLADKTYYSNDNHVRMEYEPETVSQPASLPVIDELRSQDLNFPQILDHLTANPELLAGLQFGTYYVFNRYSVVFQPRLWGHWGLSFVISPSDIRILPFGERAEIQRAVGFMLANMNRPQVTTRVIANLGVLAVDHCDHKRYVEVDERDFDEFDTNLRRGNAEMWQRPYVGRTISETVIRTLIRHGLVEAPHDLIMGDE